MVHLGDITKLSGYTIAPVDVITFGSPCQDLSIAGKRAGMAGARSGLFSEAVRIIREMRLNTWGQYPKYAIWENVIGAYTSNKGSDFNAVLESLCQTIDPNATVPRPTNGKWPHSGLIMANNYSLAWRTMDAQYWGVPQRRRRIALVLSLTDRSAAEILFKPESLCGYFAQSGQSQKSIAGNTTDCVVSCNRTIPSPVIAIQGSMIGRKDENGPNGDGVNKDVCFTLNTIDRHAVAYSPCYGISRVAFNCGKNALFGFAIDDDLSPTLVAKGPNAVCYDARGNGNGDIVPTVVGDHNGHISDYTTVVCENSPPPKKRWIVRRLTPMECERLQGFPDGWTDIGDWVDDNGKIHKTTDAPRYKALGNSIALPQWYYVLGGIAEKLHEDATMGSLFDGIGGFPKVWTDLHNGNKALCVWASEIEAFPIAVTRAHFPESGKG